MIKYSDIVETASVLAESEDVFKEGLTLVYELTIEEHKKLDEDLFYRTKQHENGGKFEHQEVIEVAIGEINFNFFIKDLEK